MQKLILLFIILTPLACKEKVESQYKTFSFAQFIDTPNIVLKVYDTIPNSTDSVQPPRIIDTIKGMFINNGTVVQLIASPEYDLLDSLYFNLLTFEASVESIKLKSARPMENSDTNDIFKSKWKGYYWESNMDTLGLSDIFPSDTMKMTLIKLLIGTLEKDNSNFIYINKLKIDGLSERSNRSLTVTF